MRQEVSRKEPQASRMSFSSRDNRKKENNTGFDCNGHELYSEEEDVRIYTRGLTYIDDDIFSYRDSTETYIRRRFSSVYN